MAHNYKTYPLTWNDMTVEVRFCRSWFSSTREIDGETLAHLEVRLHQPADGILPITETGYRSHFTSLSTVEAHGGPVSFTQSWLDEAASAPAWIERQEERRQMSLF